MKEIKAKTTFSFDGTIYEQGEIIETKDINAIIRLNEKGFIEPLSAKELQDLERSLNNKQKFTFKPKEEKED